MDSIVITPTDYIFSTQQSKIRLQPQDKVFIRQIWKYPVPTAQEVNILLQTFEDKDPLKVALFSIIVTAARPVEVTRLQWHRFVYDKEKQELTELYHETYKPSNRASKIGRHYYFKQVKKFISSKSKAYNDLLLKYQEISPKYEHNKLFPFSSQDSIDKSLRKLRARLREKPNPKLQFLLDENLKKIKGCDTNRKYRISPYGLRRFAITFLYWSKPPIGFGQDIVGLAHYIGHTNPKTTYEHYVMPKEAIGLTQEQIDAGTNLDQFLQTTPANQSTLDIYTPKPAFKFIEKGQRLLDDFIK